MNCFLSRKGSSSTASSCSAAQPAFLTTAACWTASIARERVQPEKGQPAEISILFRMSPCFPPVPVCVDGWIYRVPNTGKWWFLLDHPTHISWAYVWRHGHVNWILLWGFALYWHIPCQSEDWYWHFRMSHDLTPFYTTY